jgi:hypothetical protein
VKMFAKSIRTSCRDWQVEVRGREDDESDERAKKKKKEKKKRRTAK